MDPIYVFSIRQKETDFYLPAHGRDMPKRGFSYEPIQDGGKCPRIFPSFKSAKSALVLWLMGQRVVHHDYDYESEANESIEIIPQENRKKENMEIITFRLEML